MNTTSKPSELEVIKSKSRALRGTLAESLAHAITGAVSPDDVQLLKYHGIYMQDDRDLRDERLHQKLEPAYSYMVRLRLPGGVLSSAQFLGIAELARRYGAGSLRLTSRETVQFHHVDKRALRSLLQGCVALGLDSRGTCGDVNRNVMTPHHPFASPHHQAMQELGEAISRAFLPEPSAYEEVFLERGQRPVTVDSFYGPVYLPRKFKIALALPPNNDVDVFAYDLNFVGLVEDDRLARLVVLVGGGLSFSHDDARTAPYLAQALGCCRPEQAVAVARAVLLWQRDHGDRSDRKQARLKYTVARLGLERMRHDVEELMGAALEDPVPFAFTHRGDHLGWFEDQGGRHYGLFVPGGRLEGNGLERLCAVIARHDEPICISPNHNITLVRANLDLSSELDALWGPPTPMAAQAMACVSLPTCPLAMAESERYLPQFLSKIASLWQAHVVQGRPPSVRITGCPNGCTRSVLGEVGLVGKGPGLYNLYLGASPRGDRLGRLVAEGQQEEHLLARIEEAFALFASQRLAEEPFGDCMNRLLDTGLLADRAAVSPGGAAG